MQVCVNKQIAIEEVNKIFDQIDINQSGRVDFSEFIVAAMNIEKLISIKKIEQAFKIFDQDNNGFINKQELENIMGELEDDVRLL